MDRLKPLVGAIAFALIGAWAFSHGVPTVLEYWGSAESRDCQEFMAGEQPTATGQKLRLTNCTVATEGAAGVAFSFSDNAHEAYLPLGPIPEKARWEVAVLTSDEDLIASIKKGAAERAANQRSFEGSLMGHEGDDTRMEFAGSRHRQVLFLEEPSWFSALFGVGLSLMGLLLALGAVAGVITAIRGDSSE